MIHAAIAEYERHSRSLDRAFLLLEEQGEGLSGPDLQEARSILRSRHERAPGRVGRPLLIEGRLRAHLEGHRLDVRMDRLDRVGPDFLLAELKGGRRVDLGLVRVQLLILSYAVWDVFGRAPRRWEVELLRTRELRSLPAETDPGTLKAFTEGLLERILAGDREPRPYDPRFCSRCPARSYCPRVSPQPRPFTRPPRVETAQGSLF